MFLPKPITASSLFDAVVEAQGARVHAARRALDAPLEREFDGVRVLLAEDNEANQMVASEMLSRLGIELDIAEQRARSGGDGRAAGRYAAVLMDMQMPEMDGLAATRALREKPALHDLPIIAMTANAMKADLDACLAAGMNDHITKPIDRKALLQTLRRWLPAPARTSDGRPWCFRDRPAASPPARAAVLTTVGARGYRRGGIAGTARPRVRELAAYARQVRGQPGCDVDALRAAVASGDSAAAARHAHAIAGASGNLGAEGLRAAAKALERAGREGDADLAHLLADLETRAAVVFRSVDTLRENHRARRGAEPGQLVVRRRLARALERLQAALGDFDLSAASSALADLDRVGMPGPPAIWRASAITSTATSTGGEGARHTAARTGR